jgi:TfoX/Sxy family transcriptional regulator of competence genes
VAGAPVVAPDRTLSLDQSEVLLASSQEFVDFVLEQFDDDCQVTARKMFGEYGLYSHEKMFAMVCDDRLFIKPTEGGRTLVGAPVEASPYPGAKPAWVIEERLEDRSWLSELARITARELPEPKRRKKKR